MKQLHPHSRLLLICGIGLVSLAACQTTDSTPDAFSFASKTGVSISETSSIESESVTITGMNAAASITVTGGKYGLDGGPCVATSGTISVGQKLRLCATAPTKFGQESTVNIDVGGVKASFTASAETLDAITFAPTSFAPNGSADSAAVTAVWTSSLAELDVVATTSGVPNATGGFKIGADTTCKTSGKVNFNESIKACATVPNSTANGAKVTVSLEFGSSNTGKVTKSFEVTVGALAIDSVALSPSNFTSPANTVAKATVFTSDELTVLGLLTGSTAPISVVGGQVLVNGIAATMVKNGDKIKVSLTSSNTDDTLTTATVTVGTTGKEVKAVFFVRTAAPLGANEYLPNQVLTDFKPLVPWAKTDPAPPEGFNVADTSPTCVYGSGGPWSKVSDLTIAEFLYVRSNGDKLGFVKSNLPKADWNSCPANWNEAAIIAAGAASPNKFGKTTLTFNVAASGIATTVSKVELKLKVPHQSRADLFITLVSPDGTRVVIFDLEKDSLGRGLRGTQFSNPNVYAPAGYPLPESTGISLIFDDAAVAPPKDAGTIWTPTGDEAATIPYRCGPNSRTPTGAAQQKNNWLGTCYDNSNADRKGNYPGGGTGFGSFGRVRPSNPLSAFNGLPIAGTWTLEIEDRAPGNQESNDDTFPPFRPLDLPNTATQTNNPKYDYSTPPRSVFAVPGDDKQLVRQAALGKLTPKVRVAVLTVK
jgi:subtilisin-like proprotein convertase family protein